MGHPGGQLTPWRGILGISSGGVPRMFIGPGSYAPFWRTAAAIVIFGGLFGFALFYLQTDPFYTVTSAVVVTLLLATLAWQGIRQSLGKDELEVRDGAVWFRRSALLTGRWQRTALGDISGSSYAKTKTGETTSMRPACRAGAPSFAFTPATDVSIGWAPSSATTSDPCAGSRNGSPTAWSKPSQ